MTSSVAIQYWAPSQLRPHPENATIFGDPHECDQWDEIRASIRKLGIIEPLAVKPDGTILSGHIRHAIAVELKMAKVPVHIIHGLDTYRSELELLIRCNTDRRQLKPGEVALAYKRLKETPKEAGGVKGKKGAPKGNTNSKILKNKEVNSAASRGIEARDEAAEMLHVGRDQAEALEDVFTTPGVPDELKAAVNSGAVKATPAAKAVRAEVKRQGGTITDGSALKAVATPKPRAEKGDHEQRMQDGAEKYQRDYRELFDVYKNLDAILSRRPLKSVIGPTEHHEYGQLVRDVALRAWREVEAIQGQTNAGRQMMLSVIDGGKKS